MDSYYPEKASPWSMITLRIIWRCNSPPQSFQSSGLMNKPARAGEKKEVTAAQISTGIKKQIASETRKSSDKKFHVKHQGKDLALGARDRAN